MHIKSERIIAENSTNWNNHQNIIVYVPVVISVKVDLHNRPFKIPSILKRKRKTPTDSELLAFLNDNICI
jgi:hypothetical protein